MAALRDFLVRSSAYSLSFTFPPMFALGLFGDIILRIWMGPAYANWPLVAILVAGNILPMSQDASMRILMGMNAHGRMSLPLGAIAMLTFAPCLLWSWWQGMNVINIALASTIPTTLAYGVFVPLVTCRRLQVGFAKYVSDAVARPLLYGFPFAALLSLSRYCWHQDELVAALSCFVLSLVALCITYVMFVLPSSFRSKLISMIL